MKAVLFDYNGTLFFDADINYYAWKETINELSNGYIDFDVVYEDYKSVRNYLFVEKIFEMMGFDHDEEKLCIGQTERKLIIITNIVLNTKETKWLLVQKNS